MGRGGQSRHKRTGVAVLAHPVDLREGSGKAPGDACVFHYCAARDLAALGAFTGDLEVRKFVGVDRRWARLG